MRSAAIGTLGGWAYVFDRVLTRNAFYQWSMGTDNLSLRLGHIVEGLGGYAVVIAGCVGVGAAMRTRVLRSRWAGGVLLCGFAGGAWLLRQHLPFQVLDDVAAPLQVLLLAVTLATAAALLRATRCADRSVRERLLLQLSLCIFALVLLLRILFHVRFNHYGFCLAAPASVVLIAAGHRFLARTVAALGGQPLVAQGLMTVLLGMVLLGYITISQWHFQQKQFHVGAGVDGFLADGRAAFLVPTMNFLAEHRTEDATLAVFPEGIMANYLLRMRNPTPYGLFIPMDVRIYGEPKMLASLRASPPMWILLVHRDDTEYGVRFFGRDYAHTIANWLQENYQIIGRAGAQPFCSDSFGILVGRRIDPLTTGPGSPNAP
jgi:hypothetical protein